MEKRLRELADRAVVTAAEGALLRLTPETGDLVALDFLAVDWVAVGSYALGGAVLSLLINLARGGLTGRAKASE